MRISDWSSDVCSSDLLGETNNPEWKTVALDETSGEVVAPSGSAGFRWGEKGKWNLEEKDGQGRDTRLRLTNILDADHDEVADRKSVVEGKRVSVRVDPGGRRIHQKKR